MYLLFESVTLKTYIFVDKKNLYNFHNCFFKPHLSYCTHFLHGSLKNSSIYTVCLYEIKKEYLTFLNLCCLTVTHAAPNPVLFYAAISNFLVLRVRAE